MKVLKVRERLQKECAAAGSARAWAKQHKLSAAYVCDVLKGRREPGDGVLKPLNLRKVVSISYESISA